jgi:phenylacetate-CoA ligase
MRFDFSSIPLRRQAFSKRPMTFCDPEPKNALSAILDVIAVETGDPVARTTWQTVQLQNLLNHARQRSKFWKQRIGASGTDANLQSLPVLSRAALAEQVSAEGSLLKPGDGIGTRTNSTSGSSGVPVKFFTSAMNQQYNHIRSVAQYFMEGRDLGLNRVQFAFTPALGGTGLRVTKTDTWLGSLGAFVRGGTGRVVEYFNPDMAALRAELEKEPIGYLVAAHWGVEAMLPHIDISALKRSGLAMWLPIGGGVDVEIQKSFAAADIPVRGTYSAEEVGYIGCECERIADSYHVATSNVLVEIDSEQSFRCGDKTLGPVLVTHLHSYATPFIRYDIGDLATIADRCECGHEGPTLSDIYGRSKNLLSHADGRVAPIYIRASQLDAICPLKEFRIRQTGLDSIVVEIVGRESISAAQTDALSDFIKKLAGPSFKVQVQILQEINWGSSLKRLGFRNELL